ncbi:MAG: hypothetical protein AAGA95_06190 [Pseudomonadota bacterium]
MTQYRNTLCANQLFFLLLLTCLEGTVSRADPIEPDDDRPYVGAMMDARSPEFGDPNPDVTPYGRELIWRVEGRTFANTEDVDWIIFLRDRYSLVPFAGFLEVSPEDPLANPDLRVEILSYPRDVGINPAAMPVVLQDCNLAPAGGSSVPLTEAEFNAMFFRLRPCSLNAETGYRVRLVQTEGALALIVKTIFGQVVNARNGQGVGAAYVFTSGSTVTFSNLEDGTFSLFEVSTSPVALNFLSRNIESLGPVAIGPIEFESPVLGALIPGQPLGTIFVSGFEP